MQEPTWITDKIVLAIQEDQLAQHGGSPGIRDENLLGASLARPKHLFTYGNPTIFDLAAAYGYGLAKNHPFIDGNKRIRYTVMRLLLLNNNINIRATEEEKYEFVIEIDSGKLKYKSILKWISSNINNE